MHPHAPQPEEQLSADIATRLAVNGITASDEVALREALERRAPSYTLLRLPPAAARRWKARYRIMLGADYLDAQTVTEAYARALLATLAQQPATNASAPNTPAPPARRGE